MFELQRFPFELITKSMQVYGYKPIHQHAVHWMLICHRKESLEHFNNRQNKNLSDDISSSITDD